MKCRVSGLLTLGNFVPLDTKFICPLAPTVSDLPFEPIKDGIAFEYQKIVASAPTSEPILFGRLAGLSPLSFPAWRERDLPMDFSPRRECNEKNDSLA